MKFQIKKPNANVKLKYPYLAKSSEGDIAMCLLFGYTYLFVDNRISGLYYEYSRFGAFKESDFTPLPFGTIIELTQE